MSIGNSLFAFIACTIGLILSMFVFSETGSSAGLPFRYIATAWVIIGVFAIIFSGRE